MSAECEVEEEFDAARDSQFLECSEQIILDSMLTQAQTAGDALVCLTLCRPLNNLQLTRAQRR
jgi:hypothetical protein